MLLCEKCPTEHVFSSSEIAERSYSNDQNNMLVSIRGEAFDLSAFATLHQPGSAVIPLASLLVHVDCPC